MVKFWTFDVELNPSQNSETLTYQPKERKGQPERITFSFLIVEPRCFEGPTGSPHPAGDENCHLGSGIIPEKCGSGDVSQCL